ncbi:hypothetical protein Tco_0462141 [Tanacetum coccineum]
MGRDTVQLKIAMSTISQEYLLEFTLEHGISEGLHPELPGRGDRIIDFSEGKVGVYTKFFEFANFRIPISQFLFDILDFFGWMRRYSPPSWTGLAYYAHQRMEGSRERTPSVIKRDQSETEANAPPKVLRIDHASVRPESHTRGGKSLAAMGLGAGSTVPTPIPQETPADVIGPNPLSMLSQQSLPERDIAQSSKGTAASEDPEYRKVNTLHIPCWSPGGCAQVLSRGHAAEEPLQDSQTRPEDPSK